MYFLTVTNGPKTLNNDSKLKLPRLIEKMLLVGPALRGMHIKRSNLCKSLLPSRLASEITASVAETNGGVCGRKSLQIT